MTSCLRNANTYIFHSEIALQQLDAFESNIASDASPLVCDGSGLRLGDVAAVSRMRTLVQVDQAASLSMIRGVEALHGRLSNGEVIYGVNTLFGGSADLRTNKKKQLQHTLIRELHYGILPEKGKCLDEDSPHLSYLPPTWARAAVLIRLNSLAKGFSCVRPIIVERLKDLLQHEIIPVIPLRGSISASGDLSPLSYIAGTVQAKRTIRVFSRKPPTSDTGVPGSTDPLHVSGLLGKGNSKRSNRATSFHYYIASGDLVFSDKKYPTLRPAENADGADKIPAHHKASDWVLDETYHKYRYHDGQKWVWQERVEGSGSKSN